MNKKDIELETLYYFWPSLNDYDITEEDVSMYFEWSEDGLHKDKIKMSHFVDGFNALVAAKRWRGITMHELYEPGILDGTMPYTVICDGTPRSAIDFMKKELFKGTHAEMIDRAYALCE